MTRTTLRSGLARLFLWLGAVLVLVGILAGVLGAVLAVSTGDRSLLGLLALTAVFGIAGLLMHLAGRRSRVDIAADGVSWSGALTGRRQVPWEAVRMVETPMDPRAGTSAALLLQDGSRVPVEAISMSNRRGVDPRTGSTRYPDGGYRRACEGLVAAHKDWLARRGA